MFLEEKNEVLFASYRDDLARAQEAGRNLMTEKYDRMIKSTFPEEYKRIAAFFPPVSPETGRQIEEKEAKNRLVKAFHAEADV